MPKEPRKRTEKGHGDFYTSTNPFAQARSEYEAEFAAYSFYGQAVDRVLAQGDAIIFGTTRDGGAICITLCVGEQRHKTYVHSQIELDNAMTYIHESYTPD